jgi:ubiquinol-cytochrome c reductase subunit 9
VEASTEQPMRAAPIAVTRHRQSCRRTSYNPRHHCQHHRTRPRTSLACSPTFKMAGVCQLIHPQAVPMLTATPDARHCLQVRLPLRGLHDRPITTAILTIGCSAVLRSNTTMLFTVFGAAFGMQLYVAMEQDTRMDRLDANLDGQSLRHWIRKDLELHQQGRT